MKKLLSSVVGILIVVALLISAQHYFSAQTGTGDKSSKVLNLYNWGDYIDPALLKKIYQRNWL